MRENYGSIGQEGGPKVAFGNDYEDTSANFSDLDVSNNSNSTSSSLHDRIQRLSLRLRQSISEHTGSIGMLGSVSIAVNSLTGPAMLNLPATFQKSGIIPTIATLLFVCFLSAFGSLHMSNTISKVPGNENFKKEVEFSDAFKNFWGIEFFWLTQGLFFCCITCLNISSIVDTSQVVDTFFGHWWPGGGSVALQCLGFTEMPRLIRWSYEVCTEVQLENGECIPFAFNTEGLLITLGNVAVTILFLPLALMDLKENAAWQILGFVILIITSIQFIVQFLCLEESNTVSAGAEDSSSSFMANTSMWGSDWGDLFGVVLFNFALVIAVPAWLYERDPDVDVPTVVYGSSLLSVILYVAIGMLGSMTIPSVSSNMLESMMSGTMGTLMQLGASVFAFAIIGLGIPLFSVLTRLNLTGSGLCSRRVGNTLAVYFPFAVSWILYDGDAVTKLLSWGGIIFTSFVAFILPFVLTWHVLNQNDVTYQGSVDVYCGWVTTRKAELLSVKVLFFLAVAAVLVAIIGNFV